MPRSGGLRGVVFSYLVLGAIRSPIVFGWVSVALRQIVAQSLFFLGLCAPFRPSELCYATTFLVSDGSLLLGSLSGLFKAYRGKRLWNAAAMGTLPWWRLSCLVRHNPNPKRPIVAN